MRKILTDLAIGGLVTGAAFILADNDLMVPEALGRALLWPWYLTLMAGTDGSLLTMLTSDTLGWRVAVGFVVNALYVGTLVHLVRRIAGRSRDERRADAAHA